MKNNFTISLLTKNIRPAAGRQSNRQLHRTVFDAARIVSDNMLFGKLPNEIRFIWNLSQTLIFLITTESKWGCLYRRSLISFAGRWLNCHLLAMRSQEELRRRILLWLLHSVDLVWTFIPILSTEELYRPNFGSLTALTSLDLSYNSLLTGTVPDQLCKPCDFDHTKRLL